MNTIYIAFVRPWSVDSQDGRIFPSLLCGISLHVQWSRSRLTAPNEIKLWLKNFYRPWSRGVNTFSSIRPSVCRVVISSSIQNIWVFKIVVVSTGCTIAVDLAFNYFFFLRHGWKTPVGIRGPKNIVSVALWISYMKYPSATVHRAWWALYTWPTRGHCPGSQLPSVILKSCQRVSADP